MRRSSARCLLAFATGGCVVPGLEVGTELGPDGQGGTLPGQSGFGGSGGVATSNAGSSATGGDAGNAGASSPGGSGGDAVARCEDAPIPPKSGWQVAAFTSSLGSGSEEDPLFNPPEHVIDEDMNERWASGQPQAEGQWFHVDFGATATISEVTLQQGTHLQDYPRGYEISVSYRHTDFEAVASARGEGASVSETVIPLEHRVTGRYMMIRQTGQAPKWWSIAEISVDCH